MNRDKEILKYSNLVHKIVNQMSMKSPHIYDDLVGYAWEGLCIALNNYREGTSQSFIQYAAYQIRYNILNHNNSEGSTVVLSAYNQGKLKEDNRSTWIMKQIESKVSKNGDIKFNIKEPSTTPDYYRDEIYKYLYNYIESKFSKRDCDIFYKSFGLKDEDIWKGIDLAKKYNLTSASITLTVKKIIRYIRNNKELLSCLR